MQTTPDSIAQLRFALCKVRAAFHDYQMPVVSYIDSLVHVGTPECMEEREKVGRILDNDKHYVDTVVAEGNERKKELIAEMGSARPNSRASSTSSAALRAQARGEAAAAIKKAELQKKRNQIESQLALQIQEQEEEVEVAVAKIAAIEDELGISDPRGFDLPEERVDQRVNSYLENLCEFTPDNIDSLGWVIIKLGVHPIILPHNILPPHLPNNNIPLHHLSFHNTPCFTFPTTTSHCTTSPYTTPHCFIFPTTTSHCSTSLSTTSQLSTLRSHYKCFQPHHPDRSSLRTT